MTRRNRIFSRPQDITTEIEQFTIQLRALLGPDTDLDPLIVGAMAKAQEVYPIRLHAFTFLSDRFKLLVTHLDGERLSNFMGYFTRSLSKEVKKFRDWDTVVFPNRFKHVELSQEPAVELARLRHVLGYACEEGIVTSPADWPGVSSTKSLATGEPMRGLWIDRTGLSRARSANKDVAEDDFAEEIKLELSPLPSLEYLPSEEYRRLMNETVHEIAQETIQRHRTDHTAPTGLDEVASRHPHDRVGSPETDERPWFHALKEEVAEAMRGALERIQTAYQKASERYRAGEYGVVFPEGTFPPARPFVKPIAVFDSG